MIRKWKKVATLIMMMAMVLTLTPLSVLAATGDKNQGSDDKDLLKTGFEDRNGNGWTTLDEEAAFLKEVASRSDWVTYSQVGTSVEGRPIYLAKVGFPVPPSDKDIAAGRNILIEGTPHGNEPSGREMALKLLRNLAFTDDPEMLDLLSKSTVLFMPTPNPDGRHANIRTNINGVDVNRDHINVQTPEGRTEEKILNKYHPDIILDAHERPGEVGNPDLEVLWPRNFNVDEPLRQLNIEMVQDYVRPDVEKDDFTTGLYGRPPGSGSGSERILRNMSGLRHSLGMLAETPGKAEPKARVRMHMDAAKSVLLFYRERFDDVGKVVAEAPKRSAAAGAHQDPFYLDGTYGWDQSKYPPVILNPAPCGYLITKSQAEKISTNIKLFSLETEKVGNNGVFFTMNQPMRTVVPLLLDEGASYNEVDGIPLYSCINPGTAANMKTLVSHFEDKGDIKDSQAAHDLNMHLTAVEHFEKKEAAKKVVKHMKGFKTLLNHQKENQLISERASSILDHYADYLIEKWDMDFDADKAMDHIRHLSVDIGPRVAGSDEEKEAAKYLKHQFKDLGYEVSTQTFGIRDRVKGQLKIVSNDNEELPLSVASGSAETDGNGITKKVYDAGLGKPGDFSDDVKGNIALIKKGELTFWEKVKNATEAGAAGVIIYDNTESFSPLRLGLDNNKSSIPVVGVTKAAGESLQKQISSGELKVNLKIQTLTNQTSQNVIAVKKPRNIEKPEIVYVGSHYDSVPFAPGANDDGSGTASLLEMARVMKDYDLNKEIRFVAFGSEELGMVGSSNYVDQLTQDEIDRSVAEFQMDMVGTAWEPASKLTINTVDGKSNLVWNSITDAADKLGKGKDALELHQLGRSDHVPFHNVGIDSALFIWMEPGTPPGAANLEPYYHTPEDKIEHVSPERIQLVGDLIQSAVTNLVSQSGQLDKSAETSKKDAA